jgi:hypothetical protein
MKKSELHSLIKEIHQELLEEEKLKEGLLSWAGGVADNIVQSIITNYGNARQSAIYNDPKLRALAKDLKINQKELQNRVNTLLQKDNKFLKALATQRAKYI